MELTRNQTVNLDLGSNGVDSLWEVSLSGLLLLGFGLELVLGQSVSESLGLSWDELSWLLAEDEVGSVGFVELLELALGGPSSLDLGSLLLVDDSQGSCDGLSDGLIRLATIEVYRVARENSQIVNLEKYASRE